MEACSENQPAASSRCFIHSSSPAPSISPDESHGVSFLDLPLSVRTIVYALAIYDYDRTAVFLPRALPRKVQPDIDDADLTLVDIYETADTNATEEQHASTIPRDWRCFQLNSFKKLDVCPSYIEKEPLFRHWTTLQRPVGPDGTAGSGLWTSEEYNLAAQIFDAVELSPEQAGKLADEDLLLELEALEAVGTSCDDSEDAFSEHPPSDCDCSDYTLSFCFDCAQASCSACAHAEHGPVVTSSSAESSQATRGATGNLLLTTLPEDMVEPSHGDYDTDGASITDVDSTFLSTCDICDALVETLQDVYVDTIDGTEYFVNRCTGCMEGGLTIDDGIEDSRNVFNTFEHDDADDIEHYDTEECIGMLYELTEPAILLTRKEIRNECLPLYYRLNAFSWRFLWTSYPRSCARFKSWAESVGPEHIRQITKVTFQGRHMVEEGLEYSVDIDILDRKPYFEIRVYTDDEETTISKAINESLAEACWLITQCGQSRLVFYVGLMCELASIFIEGMYRDAAGLLAPGAELCKEKLTPVFWSNR